MDMRTVYRYENWFGKGPYGSEWRDSDARIDMCDDHGDGNHPAWMFDFSPEQFENEYGEEDCASYFAACDSREALDAWFDGWHEKLEANGFYVREYTVPAENVVDGSSGLQVAFKPHA